MGCGGKKLLKYLTQPCMTHCSATICQQVTLSGGAGWPKVAGAVIKAPANVPGGTRGGMHEPGVRRGSQYEVFEEGAGMITAPTAYW